MITIVLLKVTACFGLTWHRGGRVGQVLDACRPGPVPHERDPLRVSAELGHVLLRPLEDRHLVHDPVVGDLAAGQGGAVGVEETWKKRKGGAMKMMIYRRWTLLIFFQW